MENKEGKAISFSVCKKHIRLSVKTTRMKKMEDSEDTEAKITRNAAIKALNADKVRQKPGFSMLSAVCR